MRDKRYGVNGRQRPLIPIPSEDIPAGVQCIQLNIPDSEAAKRQLIGMLNLLCFWTSYEREDSHLGTQWAQAWRAALSTQLLENCEVPTEIRVDDICTLSWSYDDWATFDSFDPSACIVAFIDSLVPDLIQQGILDAIADGTIPAHGTQPPQSPPAVGQCKTYRVKLDADDTWPCPSPVSAGDTILIENMTGAWNDGSGFGAIGPWRCPDGGEYGLGVCGGGQITEPSDPMATEYHMIPIGHIGTEYFNPVNTFTVPSGYSDETFEIQANDGTLADNLGNIEFDVTVCTGTWCYLFDFTISDGGWVANPSGRAVYTPGVGWGNSGGYTQILRTFSSARIYEITVWTVQNADTNREAVKANDLNGAIFSSTQNSYTMDGGLFKRVHTPGLKTCTGLWASADRAAGGCTISKIMVRGTGENPFGADNC